MARDFSVLEGEGRFDGGGDSGGDIEVADGGFDGTEGAALIVGDAEVAKGFGESCDLDGVAKGSAGAVGFDVGNGGGVNAGVGDGVLDDSRLAVDAGGGVGMLAAAVIVESAALDDERGCGRRRGGRRRGA